ncbi:hypothetical protein HAX54_016502, partial [Datura stramonium]|nr:hypothetical protein [Datura stramonium]
DGLDEKQSGRKIGDDPYARPTKYTYKSATSSPGLVQERGSALGRIEATCVWKCGSQGHNCGGRSSQCVGRNAEMGLSIRFTITGLRYTYELRITSYEIR